MTLPKYSQTQIDALGSRVIYIAGPIGNAHTAGPREMYHNVEVAENIYALLRDKNYSPILPHFSYYKWIKEKTDVPWQTWVAMDEDFVKIAPIFFYMIPEKYGPSKGALHELKLAQKFNKIIIRDVNELPTMLQIPMTVFKD